MLTPVLETEPTGCLLRKAKQVTMLCRHALGVLQPSVQHTSRSIPFQCKASSNTALPEVPKAAALIIGNEILNGSVVDTNTPWLAKMLYRSTPLPPCKWHLQCTSGVIS